MFINYVEERRPSDARLRVGVGSGHNSASRAVWVSALSTSSIEWLFLDL